MPRSNFQFCDFWLPGADSESEGSNADDRRGRDVVELRLYVGSDGEDDD